MQGQPTTLDDKKLGIYLNDHRALAAAGLALARRCRDANPEPPLGPMLGELVAELEADEHLLESVMATCGVRQDRIKQIAAVAGERVGRLKPNGSLISYSPLSRLVELEGLRVGIFAKRALWESLLTIDGAVADPAGIEAAMSRADSQIGRVEEARRAAVRDAFTRTRQN